MALLGAAAVRQGSDARFVAEERDLFGVDAEAVGECVLGRNVKQSAGLLDETRELVQYVRRLRVDVQQPELARVPAQGAFEPPQDATKHWAEKRVVEEEKDRGERQIDGGRIGVEHGELVALLPGRGEAEQIALCDVSKCWVEFDAEDGAKGISAGKQKRPALAATKIDEGEGGEWLVARHWPLLVDSLGRERQGVIKD